MSSLAWQSEAAMEESHNVLGRVFWQPSSPFIGIIGLVGQSAKEGTLCHRGYEQDLENEHEPTLLLNESGLQLGILRKLDF